MDTEYNLFMFFIVLFVERAFSTNLAGMIILIQYGFTKCINPVAWAMLVIRSFRKWFTCLLCFQCLCVKISYFWTIIFYRTNFFVLFINVEMVFLFIIQRWCYPAFVFCVLIEIWFPVAKTVSSCPAILPSLVTSLLFV